MLLACTVPHGARSINNQTCKVLDAGRCSIYLQAARLVCRLPCPPPRGHPKCQNPARHLEVAPDRQPANPPTRAALQQSNFASATSEPPSILHPAFPPPACVWSCISCGIVPRVVAQIRPSCALFLTGAMHLLVSDRLPAHPTPRPTPAL